jgi:hypothetical protein
LSRFFGEEILTNTKTLLKGIGALPALLDTALRQAVTSLEIPERMLANIDKPDAEHMQLPWEVAVV